MEKSEIMKKRAYVVRIDESEGYCVVVFAENRNKAKTIAMGDDNFNADYTRYIDLKPIRMPDADYFVEKYPDIRSLDLANPEHARFLRYEGWWSEDCSYCDECGLATFDNVPESQLEYHNEINICLECLKDKENKS